MGAFVVLEGGDASGKSTQARLVAHRLRSAGREVVETFEPGATEAGAAIRALLLDGDGPVDPTAEALLLAADRAQEVADVIRPALARGADAVAASRRAGPGDRLERAGDEFHAAVRDAYRGLAADRGWVVLDGGADVDTVAERVWGAVRGRLDI